MKIYDTHSQQLREFSPLEDNKVKIYVCGPTVYDFPHLGHARCYITWDVVSRYLRFIGYDLTYVRNVTDVDDKIIKRAAENGVTPKEIADKYYEEFKKSMAELNVLPPDIEPKATETIQEMINIIKTLEEKGMAYEANGDVYFRVSAYKEYGSLGKQPLEDLQAGARVEASSIKENPLDFALWKHTTNENEICWESPWGKGRPGWHIECSAMSKKYLGESIDIHAGGQDLVFPHHENEKAQSEACFGKKFVNYWMHNGFVNINKEKMSKSLGNFLTIPDLLKTYDANTIRLFILTNHYRMPVEFSDESLIAAKNGVKRLKNAFDDVKTFVSDEKITSIKKVLSSEINVFVKKPDESFVLKEIEVSQEVHNSITASVKSFINAMEDDFNTSKAISVLFELANTAQKAKTANNNVEAATYISILLILSSVLGFDLEKTAKSSDDLSESLMQLVISIRQQAREEKNWAMSDLIRDQLGELNIELKDKKNEPTSWKFKD